MEDGGRPFASKSLCTLHTKTLTIFHKILKENVLFLVDDFQHWITQEVPLAVGLKRFIIRVIRGGRTFEDDQGDIAFDNFEIERRDCHLGTYKQGQ